MKFSYTLFAVAMLSLGASLLSANSRTIGFAGRKAEGLENRRVEKQLWSAPQKSSIANKRFPIQEWDKHFSSVGSKRAPIAVNEEKEKQLFRSRTITREEYKSFEMSEWSQRMAKLHEQAGITLDQRAQVVADRQLYGAMLQDTEQFRDLAEEVSLRDLNRYQFRRNHQANGVPVQKAAGGE